jgi:hypothetical protein
MSRISRDGARYLVLDQVWDEDQVQDEVQDEDQVQVMIRWR